MSARSDTQIALEALEILLPLGVAVVQAVRIAIESARPDIKIADPPPASRYAEILAEDEARIAAKFGGAEAADGGEQKGDGEG